MELAEQPVVIDIRIDRDVVRDRRVEPELLLGACHGDLVGVDDERRDAARRARRAVRAREEQDGAAERRVGDPLLSARDVPAAVDAPRARGQGARVRTGPGLRQREAAHALAACERRHEAGALLVAAEAEDRQRAG